MTSRINYELKETLYKRSSTSFHYCFDKYQGDQDYQFSQVQEAHATQQSQWAAALERLQTEHKREVDDLNEAHATQLRKQTQVVRTPPRLLQEVLHGEFAEPSKESGPDVPGPGRRGLRRADDANLSDHHETELISVRLVAARRGRQEALHVPLAVTLPKMTLRSTKLQERRRPPLLTVCAAPPPFKSRRMVSVVVVCLAMRPSSVGTSVSDAVSLLTTR